MTTKKKADTLALIDNMIKGCHEKLESNELDDFLKEKITKDLGELQTKKQALTK
jgi:hypothetical protein